MKGQPWLELELGGRRWELAWKGTDGGKKSRGWAASCGGQGRGAMGSCMETGSTPVFASNSCFAAALCVLCAGRKKEKRREEGEKKKKKGKGKRKGEK
jgi:hypothetical protein